MNEYLLKRKYRKRMLDDSAGRYLVDLMERRFLMPFEDYWERFGYEIGGPVCYSYTQWVVKRVGERTDISAIAFVARDGWLLKKAYNKIKSEYTDLPAYYIYAPRSLLLLSQGERGKADYTNYLSEYDILKFNSFFMSNQ